MFNNVNIACGVMTGMDYHFEILSREITRTTVLGGGPGAAHDNRIVTLQERAEIFVET